MNAEEIVRKAEAAYAAQDLELVKDLFDPNVIVYWDGKKLAGGRDAVIKLEEENFASWRDFRIKKTLRTASGDTIAVEWECSFTEKATGNRVEFFGGEFWTIRNNRLVEWHAYGKAYPLRGHSGANWILKSKET